MKKRLSLCLAAVVWIGWTDIAVAQLGKIPPEVWQKAQTEGVVPVLVQLNVPWKPEGKLSEQDRLAQRQAVAAAQRELLASLSGTRHKVRRQFEGIPGIALEVGPDALTMLEHSARVVGLTEDRVGGALQEESVPKEPR